MKTYRCPVCGKPLTKPEYEKALKIHEARQKHLQQLEARLKIKERQLPEKIEAAKKEGERKGIQKSARMMAGLKTENDKLRIRIRQLEKGTTPQTEGLEFEQKLVARLRREFRDDEVEPFGKNGDILHTVKFEKQEAGMIIYECKRTPKIQASHVRQAHLAKQSREAEFAVLVTTGQKKGFSGFAEMNGVFVVSPLGTIPLAALLRRHLIEMLKAKLTKEQRVQIAEKLMHHITSPQFKNPIDEIIHRASQLQGMIKEEAKEHFRTWKKRWDHYERIHWDGSLVRQNVELVLHGKEPKAIGRPKVSPLELPAFTG